MLTTRIAINGFGRIGRQLFKILWDRYPELEIAAIGVTDPNKTEVRALLLQHDSTYGKFPHTVGSQIGPSANMISVDGQNIPIVSRLEPYRTAQWADYGVDVVIDATGCCKQRADAEAHFSEGAKKVMVTCPTDWADATIVYGINQHKYDPLRHHIVSASSCTTTSLAPLSRVLDDNFGLIEGMVTTVHAYTSSQSLQDNAHKDPRRARAATSNIIPTTTGAARALDQVLPGMGSRLRAGALRVPVSTVSMLDLVARVEKPATPEEINTAYRRAASGLFRGIVAVSDKPLVSTDYVADSHSAILDALSTSSVGQLVRLAAWYDNEWGYSCRVADLTAHIAQQEISRYTLELAPARNGASKEAVFINS